MLACNVPVKASLGCDVPREGGKAPGSCGELPSSTADGCRSVSAAGGAWTNMDCWRGGSSRLPAAPSAQHVLWGGHRARQTLGETPGGCRRRGRLMEGGVKVGGCGGTRGLLPAEGGPRG